MAEGKPKRKRGRPLKGSAPMSPAERQRRRRQRLIEAAQVGFLVHIYAERMAGRLEMAGEQIQELTIALQEKDRPAYPGLVTKIEFSIDVLRKNLTLLQAALPPEGKRSPASARPKAVGDPIEAEVDEAGMSER